MKDYISLTLTEFLVFLFKQLIKNIAFSLILALVFFFFGRVVFEDRSPFLLYWKWPCIFLLVLLGISIVRFFFKSITRWFWVKGLAVGWNTSVKEVYITLIRDGLSKKWKMEEILEWSPEEFRRKKSELASS